MNQKMPQYYRHSKVTIPEVISLIKGKMNQLWIRGPKQAERVMLNGELVSVKSTRLQTFAVRGTTCNCCGLNASFFAIERNEADQINNRPYHLNLWGINAEGQEVLFTHDHTTARALGGANNLSNTKTMCGTCNWEKGSQEAKLVKLMKIGLHS